jgi:LuxR family maltose regulon positive regulatory protein
MSQPLLLTKLYVPPPRPKIVLRTRLIERLNEALNCKLTLVSAPAGFGKTTLISEWAAGCGREVAWLSLDEGDNSPVRFLEYFIVALQTLSPKIGVDVLASLQSSQPPPTETILTTLLNDITTLSDSFILVLDDYHLIDSKSVDEVLAFLVKHSPSNMHMVISTREDPHLPLARYRVRGQLGELRAADLRFTPAEAAEFLNRVMGLNLSEEDVGALKARTEGWIAGLQMAAISMQGHRDTAGFIQSFTGSHRFVLDYLLEEVLQRQSVEVQAFLLNTSILDRMCGSLCDAVLLDPSIPGQATLEYIERANLFIIPLDNERRWYRYHHLFGDLLRKQLGQSLSPEGIAELQIRASAWYENNNLSFEAFHHATAANDIERAERLLQGGMIPLHSHAVVTSVLDWLDFLPRAVLNARPWLWVRSAMLALNAGQTLGVEEKVQEAEKALQNADFDDKTRDLIGQIAAIRATVALAQYQPEVMISQSRRALEHLHPDNLPFRSRALRTLGFAYQLKGDRTAARQFYNEAKTISQTSGNIHLTVSAITGLGNVLESENQLHQAAESYQRALQLLSDQQPPNADQEYIGLARIFYEWNDLDTAEQYGRQSLQLARQYDCTVDRYVICEVFLARLKLARGDIAGATDMIEKAELTARQQNFVKRMPDIAAVRVLILLRQDHLTAAAELAWQYELPLTQARVLIAKRDPAAALAVLEPFRRQTETKGWVDEILKAMVLQAVALHLCGQKVPAETMLTNTLALAEPGGFIRLFIDEGVPMVELLSGVAVQGIRPEYVNRLLAAFTLEPETVVSADRPMQNALIDALSSRELDVLRLIAQGLTNQEIGERLFLALDTVKGHNRRIFDKLEVQRRTEAIARARELGLI